MSTDELQIHNYYATRAAEYDKVYMKPGRQSDLRSIKRWLPPIFANATVLEVACGTGYWTQFIAPVAQRVVAIDTSTETINIAMRRVPEERVAFRVGDALRLSPELGTFNAAFVGFWFSHIPNARRHEFLRSLNALLVPGAKVVLLDNLYVEGSSIPIADTDADGNTYQRRKRNDGSMHRVLKNFPSGAELHASLGPLGKGGKFTIWENYWAFEYVSMAPNG